MHKQLLSLIFATQCLLSFILLLSVKLFSLGFIGNSYFWFIPLMVIFYLVTTFLSIKNEKITIGILSSIFYFACLKLIVSLRYTIEPYSYYYASSVDSILTLGHVDLGAISSLFPSFAAHPPIIIVLSIVQLVTGIKFESVYTILPTIFAPMIAMPVLYGFFHDFLGLEKIEALLGLLLFNSNLLTLTPCYFAYAWYGYLLFCVCLSFLGKTNIPSRALFFIVCFVNAMTYSISSYALIFFTLVLFLLQKAQFIKSFTNRIRLTFFDFLFPLITTFMWMMYVAIIDLTVTIGVAKILLGHATPIGLMREREAVAYNINDPYSYMTSFTYIGQGLIFLLGFIGLVTILFGFRKRKNLMMYVILWLLSVSILGFFALGVDWLALEEISDYRYRFLLVLILFIIPLTVFGLQKFTSNVYRILKRKISFAIIGIIISFILFSPIADNSSIFLRRSPISAADSIAAPHQWFQLTHFISSFSHKEIIVYGARSALFLRSTGVVSGESVKIYANPGVVVQNIRGQYFVAFSRFNLYLPQMEWPANETIITYKQFELIDQKCNKLYDTGDVWLYYKIWQG